MERAENTKNTKFTRQDQLRALLRAVETFGPGFLDRDVCRRFVYRILHNGFADPGHFQTEYCPECPYCRAKLGSKKSERFWQGLAVQCRRCGKTFTARTCTALAGKSLTDEDVVLMFWLLARGETDIRIAEVVGCNRETVRLWRREING